MKKNKGFSMVELIIVIAIMAILAGALAPALIKYINKSRISTDIQTANTIATAIQTALSNETAYDDADNYESTSWAAVSTIFNANGDSFQKAVTQTIGGSSEPTLKSKKCVASTTGATVGSSDKEFYFKFNRSTNTVEIADAANHVLYPTADVCLTDDTQTSCAGSR